MKLVVQYMKGTLNEDTLDDVIYELGTKAKEMEVAGHCGYKVGKFCHMVQNLHIYDRHFNYVSELLKNETTNISPNFRLSGSKNFYDYTLDDFEFFDFDKVKQLSGKLELAI